MAEKMLEVSETPEPKVQKEQIAEDSVRRRTRKDAENQYGQETQRINGTQNSAESGKEQKEIIDVEEISEDELKKEKKKDGKLGIAYVFSSSNNTIIHITDLAGNTLSRISGGMITKHSRLKSNPTIAMFAAKRAAERPRDLGISDLYVRMKGKTGATGHGPGSHAAVKTLGKEGFRIINILDTTRVARGGPKQKGGRRGRRV